MREMGWASLRSVNLIWPTSMLSFGPPLKQQRVLFPRRRLAAPFPRRRRAGPGHLAV
jgi:hypothetical protein